MDTRITGFLPISALAIVLSLGPSHASAGDAVPVSADAYVDHVLGIGHSHCGHVIDLLICNRIRKFRGHGALHRMNAFSQSILGPLPGDLELLGVNLVSDGNAQRGPVFQISFRNSSKFPIVHFRVSIVGVLGQIVESSPSATIHVPRVGSGQIGSVQLQLPTTAMAMGPTGQQPVPFDTLVVAVDSFDELIEINELNNVAILKRSEIKVLVTDAVAAPQTAPTTPSSAGRAESAAPDPRPIPSDKANPAPFEKIDLDKLDLDDTDETAVKLDP